MKNENYQVYRKHKTEVFNLFWDAWNNAPIRPILGFLTQEEEEQYNKELDEYLNKAQVQITEELTKLGFKLKKGV